jgi:hypothetical protein
MLRRVVYGHSDARGKELDLSLSYRLSGLASGAKLEIKRRAAKTARACNATFTASSLHCL